MPVTPDYNSNPEPARVEGNLGGKKERNSGKINLYFLDFNTCKINTGGILAFLAFKLVRVIQGRYFNFLLNIKSKEALEANFGN